MGEKITLDEKTIQDWFEIDNPEYLIIPKSVLMCIPVELQQKLSGCFRELYEKIDWGIGDKNTIIKNSFVENFFPIIIDDPLTENL